MSAKNISLNTSPMVGIECHVYILLMNIKNIFILNPKCVDLQKDSRARGQIKQTKNFRIV